ncbi:hypothetical protein IWW47_005009, partial [Coemansia sp. RSA 2052]
HIPAADALSLLPPDLDFTPDLLAYLRGQLCALDQATRASDIVRNLRVGEDTQSKRQLHRLQSGFVVISETRTCPHCLKRIGSGTAFAVIPPQEKSAGPVVVHYSCLVRHKTLNLPCPADSRSNSSGGQTTPANEEAPPTTSIKLRWS